MGGAKPKSPTGGANGKAPPPPTTLGGASSGGGGGGGGASRSVSRPDDDVGASVLRIPSAPATMLVTAATTATTKTTATHVGLPLRPRATAALVPANAGVRGLSVAVAFDVTAAAAPSIIILVFSVVKVLGAFVCLLFARPSFFPRHTAATWWNALSAAANSTRSDEGEASKGQLSVAVAERPTAAVQK